MFLIVPLQKACVFSSAELRASEGNRTGMDGVSTISVLEPYHARGMFREKLIVLKISAQKVARSLF